MKWKRPHPDVFNILLQVLDDGRLTDGQGRGRGFPPGYHYHDKQPGQRVYPDHGGQARGAGRRTGLGSCAPLSAPEFLNRIDERVVFNQLKPENLSGIVDLLIGQISRRLTDQKMSLELTERARAYPG